MAERVELSVVIPMHNEEEALAPLFLRLIPCLQQITPRFEIVCIDDGSRDATAEMLARYHERDPRIKVVYLSRNFGKEAALTAGLAHARGAAVVPLDADLQDPPELIAEMVAKWREGFRVVIATRRTRPGDSWLKRQSAHWFYRVINLVSSVKIPANTGDFRLLDAQVVEDVLRLGERTRFMKGIFAWVGYPTAQVFFDRENRVAGHSQWSYWKLWRFALDGIFSFTTAPLRIWTYIGGVISLISLVWAIFIILRTIILGVDVPGYASLMVAVLFMGGIQLVSLGVVGEYVGRIYRESKQRPLYLVNKTLGFH